MSEKQELSVGHPRELEAFYYSPESFRDAFPLVCKLVTPLSQQYTITQHNQTRQRCVLKQYLFETEEQKEAVISNLCSFVKVNEFECMCKFVAYTQGGRELTAAFQYDDVSLDEYLKNKMYEGQCPEFYGRLLVELTKIIQETNQIGLTIDDINRKNILIKCKEPKESVQNWERVKILYDEREKDYEKFVKYGHMIKIYWSPEKITKQLIEKDDYNDEQAEEFIYQAGLLILDVVYECENLHLSLDDSKVLQESFSESLELQPDLPLPSPSERKRGYYSLSPDQQQVEVDHIFIAHKLNYLMQSKSAIIKEIGNLVKSMIAPIKDRIHIHDLIRKVQKYRKGLSSAMAGSISPGSKMLASYESLLSGKMSSELIRDSLKYSANSLNFNEELRSLVNETNGGEQKESFDKKQQHMPLSSTTIPSQAQPTINYNKHQVKQEERQIKESGQKERSYKVRDLLIDCKSHDAMLINELARVIDEIDSLNRRNSIRKKEYYDGSFYWGEYNHERNKREGLGLYKCHNGDLYFGLWKENNLEKGTYLFKNGESFEGVVRKGKQGIGTYRYGNGNIYQGEWKDDLKHGTGTMKYPSSSRYEGEWQKGKKHGKGTYFYENGIQFEGLFALGRKYGEGMFKFPNGTKVLGFWENNHLEGLGKIFYHNGDYFQGNFHLSQKSGQGVYKWNNEEGEIEYSGEFRKDTLEGFAKIHFRNGERYEGKIREGRRDGHGIYTYANGDKFDGEWKNDMKVLGKYVFASGEVFQGKFTQGQISYGNMRYVNGELYQGEFQNGERHGVGAYSHQNGNTLYQGQWQHDEFISSP